MEPKNKLGAGSYAEVYKANRKSDKKLFAIKILTFPVKDMFAMD
jgi:serine/threonine protein kinase